MHRRKRDDPLVVHEQMASYDVVSLQHPKGLIGNHWTIVNVVVHGQPSRADLERLAGHEVEVHRADGDADRVVVHLHDRAEYVGLVASLGWVEAGGGGVTTHLPDRDWARQPTQRDVQVWVRAKAHMADDAIAGAMGLAPDEVAATITRVHAWVAH